MYFLLKIIIYFFIYSFLGWLCETTYCSLAAKKFINRGFLHGPFCPIYGFGALFTVFFLSPFKESIFLLFIMGMLVTSTLEYATGYVIEYGFKTKYWDYSDRKFNIGGKVCLKNSLMFGVMSVLMVLYIQPFLSSIIIYVPKNVMIILALVFIIYFIIDLSIVRSKNKK